MRGSSFTGAVLISAAVFVVGVAAQFVAVYTFALEPFFASWPPWLLPSVIFGIGAFLGVFVGALTLGQNERILGSVALLFVGIELPVTVWYFAHGVINFPPGVLPCAIGGGAAILLCWLLRLRGNRAPNQAMQPTASPRTASLSDD